MVYVGYIEIQNNRLPSDYVQVQFVHLSSILSPLVLTSVPLFDLNLIVKMFTQFMSVAVAIAYVVTTATAAPYVIPLNDITGRLEVQAHRGGLGMRNEESLWAFAYAMEVGADTLEMDTLFTQDGILVVWHDVSGLLLREGLIANCESIIFKKRNVQDHTLVNTSQT